MKIEQINSIDTLMDYASNLSEQVCRSQLDASEQTFMRVPKDLAGNEFVRTNATAPKDYATTDAYDTVIKYNADLLASYYREYERNVSEHPDLLKEYLAQKLGDEFIAMMDRHK